MPRITGLGKARSLLHHLLSTCLSRLPSTARPLFFLPRTLRSSLKAWLCPSFTCANAIVCWESFSPRQEWWEDFTEHYYTPVSSTSKVLLGLQYPASPSRGTVRLSALVSLFLPSTSGARPSTWESRQRETKKKKKKMRCE